MPIPLLTTVLSKLKYVNVFLTPQLAQQFAIKVSQHLTFRLDNIEVKELRDLTQDSIQRAVNCLETFQRIENPDLVPAGKVSELYELRIAKQ